MSVNQILKSVKSSPSIVNLRWIIQALFGLKMNALMSSLSKSMNSVMSVATTMLVAGKEH